MIPKNSIDYFPVAYDRDSGLIALADFVDRTFYDGQFQDQLKNLDIHNPAKTDSIYLDVIGEWLAAEIVQGDSDNTKRRKIYTAISRQRQSGTWSYDLKLILDAITGLDSSLTNSDAGVFLFLGQTEDDPTDEFSILTSNDTGLDYSFPLGGVGDEVVFYGNIYIDLGGDASNPTAATIADIKEQLTGVYPCFILYLGYTDISGNFVQYSGGVIQ